MLASWASIPATRQKIVALGNGVVRMKKLPQDGGGEEDVVVSGGYAEIQDDEVIVLADHARRADDIDPDIVRRTRDEAIDAREACDEGDHRRAYYDNKVNWCNLLLKQTIKD